MGYDSDNIKMLIYMIYIFFVCGFLWILFNIPMEWDLGYANTNSFVLEMLDTVYACVFR